MGAVMRTPGRRYFETHWHIRLAGFIAICMLAVSVWFTYSRVEQIREPHSPHYGRNHCFDCHKGGEGHNAANITCYECHDRLTRHLLDGAQAALLKLSPGGVCMHELRYDPRDGRHTVTAFCLTCHKQVTGYVSMVNIATKKYVEVDVAQAHPIGLMPTATIYPRTLPLSRTSGAIDCLTCHDQHAVDRRLRMLRYYYPGNGHPADFRPLCNDCHPEGWLPLRTDKLVKRN